MEAAGSFKKVSDGVSLEIDKINGESSEIKISVNDIVDLNIRLSRVVDILKSDFEKFTT